VSEPHAVNATMAMTDAVTNGPNRERRRFMDVHPFH
jgi:hypothetical protein